MQKAERRYLIGSGFLAMFAIGAASAALGPVLPAWVDRFGLGWDQAGLIFTAQFLGKLLTVLVVALWGRRWTARALAATSGLLFAAGLLGIGVAPMWPLVLAGAVLFGLGHGGLDAGYNSLFTVRLGQGAAEPTDGGGSSPGKDGGGAWLNRLHLCFGVGALLAPLGISLLFRLGWDWRLPFVAIGLVALVIPAGLGKHAREEAGGSVASSATQSLRPPRELYWIALICFLYGGIETALGGWTYTFLLEAGRLGETMASFGVTAFWLLLVLGRLISIRGVRRWGEAAWVVRLAVLLSVALIGGALGASLGSPAAVVTVAGLGLSGIFPSLIALGIRMRRSMSASKAAAVFIAASSLGAVTTPWLVGIVAEAVGIVGAFWGLAGLGGLLALSSLRLAGGSWESRNSPGTGEISR